MYPFHMAFLIKEINRRMLDSNAPKRKKSLCIVLSLQLVFNSFNIFNIYQVPHTTMLLSDLQGRTKNKKFEASNDHTCVYT